MTRVALDYANSLELTVVTILSAQCSDIKVNEAAADLFAKYMRAEDYVGVNAEGLKEDIHKADFFRLKAKNLRAAMEILISKNNGQVPSDM